MLPCLKVEDSVGLVVREAVETLEIAGVAGEVLVVDNGSADRSADVASLAGARVIAEKRPGYGRAIRSGISAALGPIVVMADADWTYDMTKLPLLVEPVLRGEADLAIGSRFNGLSGETMPLLHRYVGTPILTELIRRAGGQVSVSDSQSGCRCFRKDAISGLKLSADGMEFASEMLIKGSRHRLRVVDVPTGYRKRIGTSKLNTFGDGWRHLRMIILLAPELFFIAPGLLLFLIGAVLSAAALLDSNGIEVGSLRWQPVFFATIALVLGLQTILVGLVFLWRRAALTGARIAGFLDFIRAASFPPACSIIGAALLLAGLALDAFLLANSVAGRPNLTRQNAIASLAQSLLLVGGSLASFGLIVTWLHWDERQKHSLD